MNLRPKRARYLTSLSELLDDDLAFIETAKFVSTNFGTSIEIELEAERLGVKDYSVHTLKKYREFYRIFPRLAIPIRDYLVERFGKGYSVNIQLPLVGETIPCVQELKVCQIGYSPNIQSNNLLEFDDKGENV